MTEDSHTAEIADDRVFLVVVDETEEMKVALRYACGRAHNTNGRVALLYVIEGSEFQHWMSVGDLMREEARTTTANHPRRSKNFLKGSQA